MLTKILLFSRYSFLLWTLFTGISLYLAGDSGLIGLTGTIGFFAAITMLAISFGYYLKKRGSED